MFGGGVVQVGVLYFPEGFTMREFGTYWFVISIVIGVIVFRECDQLMTLLL